MKKEYIKEISGLGRIEKATLDDIVVLQVKENRYGKYYKGYEIGF